MLYYILFWQTKYVTINISHICGKMFILEFSFVCLILSTLRTSVLSLFYFWRFMWAHTNMRKHLITKQIVPEEFFRRMWRLKSYVNKLLDDFWCLTPLSTIFSYIMSTKLLESLSWIRFYYTSIKQIPA